MEATAHILIIWFTLEELKFLFAIFVSHISKQFLSMAVETVIAVFRAIANGHMTNYDHFSILLLSQMTSKRLQVPVRYKN